MLCLMSSAPSPTPHHSLPLSPLNVITSGLQIPTMSTSTEETGAQSSQQANLELLLQRVGLYGAAGLQISLPHLAQNSLLAPIDQFGAMSSLSQLPTSPRGSASSLSTPSLPSSTSSTLAATPISLTQLSAPSFHLPISGVNLGLSSSFVTPIPQIITPLPSLSVSPPSASTASSSLHQLNSSSQILPLNSPYMEELDIPTCSYNRRQSAPEQSIRPHSRASEKRRYSDFSIDALLRPPVQSRPLRGGDEKKTSRKQRTIYGLRQTEVLEEAFHTQRYMVGAEREMLAHRLGLSEAQVRVWFQNRRSKQRKINRLAGQPEQPGSRL